MPRMRTGHQDFNPHSREGSDKVATYTVTKSSDFNPHSREGSDDKFIPVSFGNDISIHTPAKGVTAILPNFRLYIL